MADVLAVRGVLRLGSCIVPIDLGSKARRTALVGPSGAGKTTLVRALAGLVRVGSVAVRGAVWEDHGTFVPPWERGIGWVPQDATLLPHVSVRANIVWARPDADPLPVTGPLGITHLLERRPRNLSGGERQRVALARALLSARTLLLLDEPFSALDRPRREAVAAFVDAFAAERDLALVLVSHDELDVERLTDQIVHLPDAAHLPEPS